MIPAGMFRNIGRGLVGAGTAGAGRFLKTTMGRTIGGAALGGAWGAVSDDTSVLGGALMGAAGGRYLGAGLNKAMRFSGAGLSFGAHSRGMGKSFLLGTMGRARLDYKGVRLLANKGMNVIGSTLKSGRPVERGVILGGTIGAMGAISYSAFNR